MKLTTVSTSSLIGVAIACSGNVLISLALTVQKLAHKRQNDELVASQSSSGSSSTSDVEPNVDPGPDPTDSDHTFHDEPSPTPSPRQQAAVAVPVVMIPSSSSKQQDDLLIRVEPGTAKSQETVRPGGEGSVAAAESEGRAIAVEPVQLVPVPVEAQPRTRSPSPGPIRIPPGYKTDIDLSDRNTSRPPKSHSHHVHRDSHHHHEGDDKPQVEEGMYLKSRLWWLGLSLIAVGEGGNFLSYGFAPASVVAPLGTVALIANCIFAPLILREKFHAKELIGMGLAIVGAITVVYSSNASNPRLDPQGLVIAIRQIPFIVYTCLNLVFMIILSLLSRSQYYGSKYIAIDVGVCALFGGYTVLSTKALSSLLSTIFLAAFADWITWVLVVVLVVTSVLQVKFLNRALMRFQSKEVIPTQFVFFSLAAIIGSAVLYQEFRDVSPSSFINFVFGIATTFLGVHLLTSFSEDDTSDTASEHSETTSRTATYRPFARSMPTNASLNVLLPTTSRLSSHNGLPSSFSERTPLLLPVASPEVLARSQSPGEPGPNSLGRIRLIKKSSNGDFTPTLGLGSQAGFLLMATTPPNAPLPGSLGRRTASYLRGGGDEEANGRRASTGPGRSAERSNTVPG